MTDLQIKSLNENLTSLTKKLSDIDFINLTRYVCYKCLEKDYKPSNIESTFVNEMFGEDVWNKILIDERGDGNKYFTNTALSTRDIVRTVRIALMQEGFHRLIAITENKTTRIIPNVPPEDRERLNEGVDKVQTELSLQDKKDLRDILHEHKFMLQYQLDDLDFDSDDTIKEERDNKKRHLKFIKKFGKMNII